MGLAVTAEVRVAREGYRGRALFVHCGTASPRIARKSHCLQLAHISPPLTRERLWPYSTARSFDKYMTSPNGGRWSVAAALQDPRRAHCRCASAAFVLHAAGALLGTVWRATCQSGAQYLAPCRSRD